MVNNGMCLQYAAEAHIVTTVAKGEAPAWGCDSYWDGGPLATSKCVAVFAIMYKLGTSSPDFLDKLFAEANLTVGSRTPFSEPNFTLERLLPQDDYSYYTYPGAQTPLHLPACGKYTIASSSSGQPCACLASCNAMST